MLSKVEIDRYLARTVTDEDGCMIWQGANNGRYGEARLDSKKWHIHKLIALATCSDIDMLARYLEGREYIVAMHTCDKPLCINPEHLKLATQSDTRRLGLTYGIDSGNISRIVRGISYAN